MQDSYKTLCDFWLPSRYVVGHVFSWDLWEQFRSKPHNDAAVELIGETVRFDESVTEILFVMQTRDHEIEAEPETDIEADLLGSIPAHRLN